MSWNKGVEIFLAVDPGEENTGIAVYNMRNNQMIVNCKPWEEALEIIQQYYNYALGKVVIFSEKPVVYGKFNRGQALSFAYLKIANAMLVERWGEGRVFETQPNQWKSRLGLVEKPTAADVLLHLEARGIVGKLSFLKTLRQDVFDAICICLDGMDNF